MKLSVVGDIISAVYNNGRPHSSSGKMDRRDFYQFALASMGDIIRKIFYEERELQGGDVTSFVSSMVSTTASEVVKGKLGIRYADLQMLMLPKNTGIFNIWPIMICGEKYDEDTAEIDFESPFTRLDAGQEWYYTPSVIDDLGIQCFSMQGGRPVLLCSPEIKYVAVQGITKEDDYEIPEYVARAIILDVLGPVLKVFANPVDMTQNGNPNMDMINQKLAEAQK